ncbi:MAG: histidinol-phosphatase HisJ family protein [bacterium]|nr:histidinol-phosphatase HisJ family protein [bacterium]
MPDAEHPIVEPLFLDGLADYHCHCDYSIDATGSIDEYCRVALARGLVELCFTTHYDANATSGDGASFIKVKGKDQPANPDNLAPYVEEVLEAHDRYYPLGLSVKLGLEFGWYAGCEEEVAQLRGRYPFEYFLCGIHELENICFCCHDRFEACFSRFSVEEAVDKYAAEVAAAAETGLFNTIAHLDYLRKYGQNFYGPQIDDLFLSRGTESVFNALKRTGTALEVNTAGMRRQPADYFPRVKLLNQARRAGVDIRYLGSDAHRPEDVGYDFDAAASLITDHVAACLD